MVANSKFQLPLLGKLPSTWKIVRFGDALEGRTRNGIYKPKEYHGAGVKMVNMGELFGNPRLHDIPMKRVQLNEKEQRKTVLQRGDLLFARRSVVAEGAGKCAIVCDVTERVSRKSVFPRWVDAIEHKSDHVNLNHTFTVTGVALVIFA